jgi:hypothetical protein
MLQITPGMEEEFRYFQGWLAANLALERLIESIDHTGKHVAPCHATDKALSRPADRLRVEVVTVWRDVYTSEKLRQFDLERLEHTPRWEMERPRPFLVAPLASVAGSALQRVGNALEAWGAPLGDPERQTEC